MKAFLKGMLALAMAFVGCAVVGPLCGPVIGTLAFFVVGEFTHLVLCHGEE